jgi:hypothetical protein
MDMMGVGVRRLQTYQPALGPLLVRTWYSRLGRTIMYRYHPTRKSAFQQDVDTHVTLRKTKPSIPLWIEERVEAGLHPG